MLGDDTENSSSVVRSHWKILKRDIMESDWGFTKITLAMEQKRDSRESS